MNPDTLLRLAPQIGGRQLQNGREPELSGLRTRFLPPLVVHIDDEPALLDLVRLVLVRMGHYRVEGFLTGSRLIEFCHTTRPNILLTDVSRPCDNWLEVCLELRKTPCLHDLPILILTACRPSEFDVALLGAECLTKPFSPTELLASVSAALNRSC
jgi:DNA-binding response OmpR family regulator